MPQMSLAQFGRSSMADFASLQTHIDQMARQGHSYEFRDCLLLPGCLPPTGTLGFWRDNCGYALYISPAVTYRGKNQTAARFFQNGRQGFERFEAMANFLRRLAQAEEDAPATPPPMPRFSTPSQLTDTDQIAPPRQKEGRLPTLAELELELGQAVLGQEQAVASVAFSLYAHIGKQNPARPLSLIFHGPTGVGKSELGKQIPRILNRCCGKEIYQFVWTELNTFSEPHSVYRLTGAPPGYVGYEDKPVFEAVAHNPKTVFMFDELEKAHPQVLKTFMSVLDEGRCAARKELPNHARELDFRQCIFLFTTNSDLSTLPGDLYSQPSVPCDLSPFAQIFLENERARRAMSAGGCLQEIAGRFSGFAAFRPLNDTAKISILARQIAAFGEEYGLHIVYISPAMIQTLLDQTESHAFSVRSHVSLIEGYFSPLFVSQAPQFQGQQVRLEGDMYHMRLVLPDTGTPSRIN